MTNKRSSKLFRVTGQTGRKKFGQPTTSSYTLTSVSRGGAAKQARRKRGLKSVTDVRRI